MTVSRSRPSVVVVCSFIQPEGSRNYSYHQPMCSQILCALLAYTDLLVERKGGRSDVWKLLGSSQGTRKGDTAALERKSSSSLSISITRPSRKIHRSNWEVPRNSKGAGRYVATSEMRDVKRS